MTAAGRGAVYGGAMFAAGLVLGTVRTLLVAPRLGPVPAVLIELPVMLALSWWIAGRLMRPVPRPGLAAALGTGAVALAVLWALELALAVLAFGVPLAEAPAAFLSPGGRIGAAGQLACALFPAIRAARG